MFIIFKKRTNTFFKTWSACKTLQQRKFRFFSSIFFFNFHVSGSSWRFTSLISRSFPAISCSTSLKIILIFNYYNLIFNYITLSRCHLFSAKIRFEKSRLWLRRGGISKSQNNDDIFCPLCKVLHCTSMCQDK